MGLTVQTTIKCPKCDYTDTFSMRHGMGDEEARPGEKEWEAKCQKELASEHPNHKKAKGTTTPASADEKTAKRDLGRIKGKG